MPTRTPIRKLSVAKGAAVFREGDADTTAYHIVSGRVEVTKQLAGRRLVLARLGPGQFFGEMSLVLDSPRSATVTASEDCVLRVITRQTFNRWLRREPENVLPLLRVLFERLRVMNQKYLLALENQILPEGGALTEIPAVPKPARISGTWLLHGETDLAKRVVGSKGTPIKTFPFRIGCACEADDAFSLNDLCLPNPLRHSAISRNHCALDQRTDGAFVIQDRGSAMGTLVNGERVGGAAKLFEATLSPTKPNTLVFGTTTSPFRFTLTFKRNG